MPSATALLLSLALAVPPPDAPSTAWRQRIGIAKAGNFTLLSWGAANGIGGLVGTFTSDGTWRYFHQANAIWNTVNIAIAIAGIVGNYRAAKRRSVTLDEALRSADRATRVLTLNMALDIAYMGTGVLLWQWGMQRDDRWGTRLEGWGQSLVFQGAFLMAYDIVMAAVTDAWARRTRPAVTAGTFGLAGRF